MCDGGVGVPHTHPSIALDTKRCLTILLNSDDLPSDYIKFNRLRAQSYKIASSPTSVTK